MPTGVPHYPKCPKFNYSAYPSSTSVRNKTADYTWWQMELTKHTAKPTGREISRGAYRTPKREIACTCGHVWWSINPNWKV